jgi:hypothetical protein
MTSYRERFREGMDRYKAGAFAEAVGFWEPIYRELGKERGYRLAYNLGIAYDELGNATGAAEHFESFLAQVAARRSSGDAMPAIVDKEEADARARVDSLASRKGRIRVDPGSPPAAVQVDAMDPRVSAFVAWVDPGEHSVVYGPGAPSEQTRHVQVRAGEVVSVSPPPQPPAAPAPSATATVTAPAPPSESAAPEPPPPARIEAHHPFSPVWIGVSGGLAVLTAVAAVPLNVNAWSARNQAIDSPTTGDRSSFDTARSWAYGATGVGIGLGVVTAGLAAWYFLGTSERRVEVTPAGVVGRF